MADNQPNNPQLRRLVRQLIEQDSQWQRLKRRALFALDAALFLMLAVPNPTLLILWLPGFAAHFYATFPALFKKSSQSAHARQHADRLKARRALERLGVGIAESSEKSKSDAVNALVDDGELALPWYPDNEALRSSARYLIRSDRSVQRDRLKRSRLIHVLLFFAHALLFVGAATLLTPPLDAFPLFGWAAGLLLHGCTVYMIEPAPEDDERRIQFILDNVHHLDILEKAKKSDALLQLSDDGELVLKSRKK
jgi:hypothetical protein